MDWALEADLYRHDLDGDGSFSEAEMTPEAREAQQAFTSDTGRVFAPVFAIPITFGWTVLNFLWLAFFELLFVYTRLRRSGSAADLAA